MSKLFKKFFTELSKEERRVKEVLKKHLEWDKKLIQQLRRQGQKFRIPGLKQLKYLSSFLNQKEKQLIFIFGGLLIVSSILLAGRIYYRLPLKPVVGGEHNEGIIINQPFFLKPLVYSQNETDLDFDLNRLIFSSLVKWQNNQLIPDLAEKWTINPESKTYVFELKKNIFWHDGKILTSEDVIFTLEEIIHRQKTESPFFASLKGIKFKRINDYKIEISQDPLSPNLLYSLTFGILPKHLWQNTEIKKNILNNPKFELVGTGPFQFKSLTKDENGNIKILSLKRNKNYYLSSPYLEKINLIFFDSFEEAFNALLTKKINSLAYFKKEQTARFNFKELKKDLLSFPYYTAIFLNQKNKIIASKTIRKVLTLAVDKEKITEELGEEKKIFNSAMISPVFLTTEIKKYNFQPKLAEEILTKDGWLKKGEKREKKKEELRLNLITLDSLEYKKVAKGLKDFWTAVGIKINLEILPIEKLQERIKTKNYDMLLYSVREGYDPDPFPLWHSSQIKNGLNLSSFENRKVDILLEKARLTFDQEEKKKLYQEFQEIIAEEIGFIPLYQTNYYYLLNQKIKNFSVKDIVFPADRFSEVEKWYLKTRRLK